jgi:hypothetical protein
MRKKSTRPKAWRMAAAAIVVPSVTVPLVRPDEAGPRKVSVRFAVNPSGGR